MTEPAGCDPRRKVSYFSTLGEIQVCGGVDETVFEVKLGKFKCVDSGRDFFWIFFWSPRFRESSRRVHVEGAVGGEGGAIAPVYPWFL